MQRSSSTGGSAGETWGRCAAAAGRGWVLLAERVAAPLRTPRCLWLGRGLLAATAQPTPALPCPLPPPQELAYGSPGVLGHAATWPQAAAALPAPPGAPAFDWEGDRPLGLPLEDLVIYEMHVRGFTADPTSGVSAPGAPPRRAGGCALIVQGGYPAGRRRCCCG